MQFTQDGSSNIPSYQISVSTNGLQSANIPAGVFFTPIHQPPQLIRPLGTQSVTVGQAFSFTIQDSFIDPQNEPVHLSAQYRNSSLPAWLSFDAANERFTGTAPNVGLTDITVTAIDAEGLSVQTDVVINALSAPTTNTPYLQKALISAGVSGGVGVGFYLFKLCLKRAADKKLIESLQHGQDDFDRDVVKPIAQAISRRVKITSFSGISENTLEEFKGAVRTLIAELSQRGINFEFDKIKADKRDELINEIATQTRLYLSEKRSCGKALCSFFGAEASPEDIRKAAPNIAQRIVDVIEHRQGSQVVMTSLAPVDDEEPSGADLRMQY